LSQDALCSGGGSGVGIQFQVMPRNQISGVLILLLFFLLLAGIVTGQGKPMAATATDLGHRVSVYPAAANVWIVESLAEFGSFGTVSSNALVVAGDRSSILIDTPADDAQTKVVLDWAAQTLGRPVEKLIVTHAHRDRIGGIHESNSRGIAAYAIERTRVLARKRGYEVPQYNLRSQTMCLSPVLSWKHTFPGTGTPKTTLWSGFLHRRSCTADAS